VPADRFEALRTFLDIPAKDLSEVVGIPSSTLSRRRKRGSFDKDESERLLRLARIAVRAVDVMESADTARQWLTEPARALGGEPPLHFADTEPGAREVERLLGRMEHGVFS
jgi:putative toxin-antitoxin system antitoxin component (TIGR02293 family)